MKNQTLIRKLLDHGLVLYDDVEGQEAGMAMFGF
jgi:hypothetical protein